jgi:hypothetical protein
MHAPLNMNIKSQSLQITTTKTIHCNEHHLKVRLKMRKSRQPCLPNESKNHFVVLNVNFSVVNLVEAIMILLTSFGFLSMIRARLTGLVKDQDSNN